MLISELFRKIHYPLKNETQNPKDHIGDLLKLRYAHKANQSL